MSDAVLSDGPDRGADLVGYAPAHVLPLHQTYPSDKNPEDAIDDLAKATRSTVTRVSAKVDAICPGATS